MSTLYITEFVGQGRDGRNQIAPIVQLPPIAEQTVAVGGSSAASSAFNANTGVIRLEADVVCSVVVGATPTAAATNMRLAANAPEYFTVAPGQSLKVAVITNT